MSRGTILHCIPSLAGGGSERQLSLLVPALQAMGWDNHVAYARGGVHMDTMADCRIPTISVGGGRVGSLRTLLDVCRLVGKLRPDIVQTWLPHMDIVGGIAALIHGTPWLISERSSGAAYTHGISHRLRERLGHRADYVVANSLVGANFWRSVAPNVRRTTIVNAVPHEQILAQTAGIRTRSRSVGCAQRTIVAAGRFSPEKDPQTLIRAITAVLKTSDNVQASIFGEGPLEPEIRQLASSQLAPTEATRLRIGGYTSDLWIELARADLFVSVSWFEGSPNVPLEAAACGCPLVLSDIPAHREIFDHTSAYFVTPRNPDNLAQVISHVLENPAEANRKAGIASELAARRSVGSMVRQYDSLYRMLLEEGR